MMIRTCSLILLLVSIASCGWLEPYKINIQQGNVLKQKDINQLQPGMTRQQVRYLLGAPMIADTFNQDRWDYLYSVQMGDKPRTQERITLWFEGDSLVKIIGDYRPEAAASTDITKANP